MEKVSEATARYVKGAATKVRLVANMIRGRGVPEALGYFSHVLRNLLREKRLPPAPINHPIKRRRKTPLASRK